MSHRPIRSDPTGPVGENGTGGWRTFPPSVGCVGTKNSTRDYSPTPDRGSTPRRQQVFAADRVCATQHKAHHHRWPCGWCDSPQHGLAPVRNRPQRMGYCSRSNSESCYPISAHTHTQTKRSNRRLFLVGRYRFPARQTSEQQPSFRHVRASIEPICIDSR